MPRRIAAAAVPSRSPSAGSPSLVAAPRRDPALAAYFAPLSALRGVGPAQAAQIGKALRRAAGGEGDVERPRTIDLLFHPPSGAIQRRRFDDPEGVEAVEDGVDVMLELTVEKYAFFQRRGRGPIRIHCRCGAAAVDVAFFRGDPDYIRDRLPIGATRLVCGKAGRYRGRLQITHPDRILKPGENEATALIEPVYPLTAGLSPHVLRRAVRRALSQVPPPPEWLDDAFLRKRGWPSFAEALRSLHNPSQEADLDIDAPPRSRLAYDEFLAGQLLLHLVRDRLRERQGRAIRGDGALRAGLLATLPFQLTDGQRRAIAEIEADLAAERPMLRLLQGDVGSGKTVVALAAMLIVAEAGSQAALMAPTELLARQHFAVFKSLCRPLGVEVGLLCGGERASARAEILGHLRSGGFALTVGTHALFQDDVRFADLRLAAIDEQHRFGVDQRWALSAKGSEAAADLLAMSATPIPRTLMLTAYGDIAVSRLTEKPAGRRPVLTAAASLDRLEDVLERLGAALERGERAYWICPLVSESDNVDVTAVEARHEALRARFGDVVGIVHGRMKRDRREAVMKRFQDGKIRLLTATAVIEVGVDVPQATAIVIEHAERFGLAQLHQLRGRVGRGDRPSSCVLLYRPPLTETARRRLDILRRTEDGFAIAEVDFRLRGAGETLGLRQSGMPAFRFADPLRLCDLLKDADDEARRILAEDPVLSSPRGRRLRLLLQLFERDGMLHTLQAP